MDHGWYGNNIPENGLQVAHLCKARICGGLWPEGLRRAQRFTLQRCLQRSLIEFIIWIYPRKAEFHDFTQFQQEPPRFVASRVGKWTKSITRPSSWISVAREAPMTSWGEESGNPMSKLSLTSRCFWVIHVSSFCHAPCDLWWSVVSPHVGDLSMFWCAGFFYPAVELLVSCFLLSAQTWLNYSWQHTEIFRGEYQAVWHNPSRTQLTWFNFKKNLGNASEIFPWGTSKQALRKYTRTHTDGAFLQVSNLATSTGINRMHVRKPFSDWTTWKPVSYTIMSWSISYLDIKGLKGIPWFKRFELWPSCNQFWDAQQPLLWQGRSLIVFESRFFVEYQS